MNKKLALYKRGFTLIELLVVITIIGTLAAAILIAINPIQKISQANDSKVKSDIGQMATAMQAYYTRFQYYPNVLSALSPNELNNLPAAPGGYSAYVLNVAPGGCLGTQASPCTGIAIYGQIKASTSGNTVWCYRASLGTAGEAANAAACPAP